MSRRSVWAIVAGLLFNVILTTLIDVAFHAAKVYPPMPEPLDDNGAMLATSYRLVIAVFGAWLTARLAPDKPMKHALVGGVIGTVISLAGVIVTWNRNLGPHWYPILLVLTASPLSWLGAKIFELQAARGVQRA